MLQERRNKRDGMVKIRCVKTQEVYGRSQCFTVLRQEVPSYNYTVEVNNITKHNKKRRTGYLTTIFFT
jgi:hypothetical protein